MTGASLGASLDAGLVTDLGLRPQINSRHVAL